MAELILVIEGDRTAAEILAMDLRSGGFEVVLASDGTSGLDSARSEGFDLIICDLPPSHVDGYELCRQLKADHGSGSIPLIVLTPHGEVEPVSAALEAGADDFIAKPYEFSELAARINMLLNRAVQERTTDPLTQLPGNVIVENALRDRLQKGKRLALLLISFNGTRPYREVYGRKRFEEFLRFAADIIKEVIRKQGSRQDLAAFLGSGTFSILTIPGRAEAFCRSTVRLFGEGIKDFYATGDLERGCITTFDRRGGVVDNQIMTVSIGAVSNEHRRIQSHWEAAEIAKEVLDYAITFSGSTYCMDRRRDQPEENP